MVPPRVAALVEKEYSTLRTLVARKVRHPLRDYSRGWSPLYHLLGGPKRLPELARLVPEGIDQQLRELEDGLAQREVFAQVPPRVDCSAMKLGLSLEPVMLALCAWGRRHAGELNELDALADCVVRPVSTRA